jgi:hypothetical protein
VFYCDRLKGTPRSELVEVQTVKGQLSDSDSSTGNKSEKSPPHKHKITHKSTLKRWMKHATKDRILFLSLKSRESTDMLCLNELFPFCKIPKSQ